jgi:hypothetical protein
MAMRWQAAALGLAATMVSTASQADCSLSSLGWMAGVWQSRDEKTLAEERWVATPSGQLMGSSWSAHFSGQGGVAEASTIVNDGGTVTLRLRHFDLPLAHAREDKDAPMVFTSSSCGLDFVVFDGQGDRQGEHIAYKRAGDEETFIGDFLHQGKPLHVEQKFTKALP